MKEINKIGKLVTCPACGWRDPGRVTSGRYAGWLKCQNPACGLTWHEEYRERPERTARRRDEQRNR